MTKDLYKVLGVKRRSTPEEIKKTFRDLAKKHHPDVGGNEEEFKAMTHAYEVLSDPDRRKRYDSTGRDDEPISKEEINSFIQAIMNNVVNAQRPDGSTDDPAWENILQKILDSMASTRQQMRHDQREIKRKLKRAQTLLRRFRPKQEHDPIGDFLRDRVRSLESDVATSERLIERSEEAARVLRTYDYEMGPDPEGQYESDPTLHLTSGGVLHVRRRW